MGILKKVDIQPGAYLMGALLLMILPLRLVFAWAAAAVIHEAGHLLALWLTGGEVRRISVGPFGASIEIGTMLPGREVLCALAGPLVGMATFLFFRWIPYICLFALVQSLFNLLPVYPLDGGRVLRSGLTMLAGEDAAERVCRIVEYMVKTVLLIFGILASGRLKLGAMPLIAALLLITRPLLRKIPCKRRPLGLQ